MYDNLKKTKSNKKTIIVAAAVSLLITAAIIIQIITPGIVWFFTPKTRARDGIIETVEGIEHIKDVPEGEIKYLINNNVTLKNDNSKGDFMFENPSACRYTLRFFIYEIVGDDGEENLIYSSSDIAPGQYVLNDKLNKKLPAGKYSCVYFARAFLDGEYVGERSGDMTVTVSE